MLQGPGPRSTPRRTHRWLLAEAGAGTLRRFREGWAAVPTAGWHRWLWTCLAGLIGGGLLTLALCWVARGMERAGRLGWEAGVLEELERATPDAFSWAIWAETPGNSVFMIPAMVAVALAFVWSRRPMHALTVLASFFMLDLLVLAGWLVWNRQRPDLVAGGLASPGLHSFPSGHLAQMVSAYGFLVWLWVRASRSWLERVLAVALHLAGIAVVSFARLRLGSHWPTDLVAGAVIGLTWLGVMIAALRGVERHTSPRPPGEGG